MFTREKNKNLSKTFVFLTVSLRQEAVLLRKEEAVLVGMFYPEISGSMKFEERAEEFLPVRPSPPPLSPLRPMRNLGAL